MKNLIIDTKDPIEKIWFPIININFPNYAIFWSKFIGVRNNGTILKPYKLSYNSTMTSSQKRQVRDMFDEISRHHYTLFCNLAGAHYQLDLIRKTNDIVDYSQKHFQHWESFDNFYIKLGNCIYQNAEIWKIVLKMSGKLLSPPRSMKRDYSNIDFSIMNVLITYRKKSIWRDYVKIRNIIKYVRDDVVHNSRKAGSFVPSKGFIIPFRKKVSLKTRPPQVRLSWLKQVRSGGFFYTFKKAKNDLDFIEKTINDVHFYLIKEVDSYLTNNNIKVVY